ncbi:hypothetical protein Trydic_g3406 [Trypoxylus dichotomus]
MIRGHFIEAALSFAEGVRFRSPSGLPEFINVHVLMGNINKPGNDSVFNRRPSSRWLVATRLAAATDREMQTIQIAIASYVSVCNTRSGAGYRRSVGIRQNVNLTALGRIQVNIASLGYCEENKFAKSSDATLHAVNVPEVGYHADALAE